MAKRKGKSPPPPNPSIVSTVAADRYVAAIDEAGPPPGDGFPGPSGAPKQAARDWLRSFVDGLSLPAQPSHEEARAAVYSAGLQRVELDPEDPRLMAILAPAVVLTPKLIQEYTGLSAPGARRAAQVLRDEGRLVFTGRGEYRIPAASIYWPPTDRDAGWVVTKGGKLYAL